MSLVVTDTNWAVHEFADADLGDERRTTRLVELAYALGQHPTAALPEACGTGSMLKAAYRFFDNDGIAPQDILQSHVEATYTRLGAVPVVLAVQDTTEVNWTRHPATQGLGPLGHSSQGTCRSRFAWPEFSPLRHGDHFCRPSVACVLSCAHADVSGSVAG